MITAITWNEEMIVIMKPKAVKVRFNDAKQNHIVENNFQLSLA